MADVEVQAKKIAVSSAGKDGKNVEKTPQPHGKQSSVQAGSARQPGTPATKVPATKAPPSTASFPTGNINNEVLLILQELNNKFNRQSSKIESVAKKVDELYEYDYENEEYDPSYCESDDGYLNAQFEDSSVTSEPPLKKSCTEHDKFKDLCDKYQVAEKCDSEINDNLAIFINSSFRNGIPEETLSEMMKDIHRPINCEALVKTKVNSCIWRLLKPQTQTDDIKFQTMQNVVVKASINLAKLLDKESDNLDSQSMEWCTNALALLGQSYKCINNKRKECHRSDLDPRFYPLTSSSLPYTDNLYGDDINKNVRDIQDLSKIGKDLSRQQPQGRGFYRRRGGRRALSRGRGRGGYPNPRPSDPAGSKNPKTGYKK